MIFRYWFFFVGVISLATIGTALIAEYYYKLEPCSMCLKQRYPYYIIIIVFFIFGIIKKFSNILFYICVQFSSIYGLFYSIWHVGIEQKFFKAPSSCVGSLNKSNSIDSLKEQIMNKAVINCEDVIWSFYGISAASINALILLLIFFINAIYLYKNYASKKISA